MHVWYITVYLPTWKALKSTIHVGRYTIHRSYGYMKLPAKKNMLSLGRVDAAAGDGRFHMDAWLLMSSCLKQHRGQLRQFFPQIAWLVHSNPYNGLCKSPYDWVDYTLNNLFLSPNRITIRGSYFKYTGEGSQIFWIRFGGGLSGVVRGVLWCSVGGVYSWVYADFWDSFWEATGFLNAMMQSVYFVLAASCCFFFK